MKKLYTTIALLFGIIIFAQDGTLEPSFGTGGIVTIAGLGFPQAVTPQQDGKTIMVGNKLVGVNYVSFIARININGTLDTTFSGDGIVTENTAGSEFISVQTDINNNIIVGQRSSLGATTNEKIYRYTSAGNLDTTFGSPNGFITAGALFTFVQNEKIISAYDNGGNFVIQKFSPNGVVESSFNSGNPLNIAVDPSFDVTCKAITTDYYSAANRVFVTGYTIAGDVKTYEINYVNAGYIQTGSFTDTSIKFTRSIEIGDNNSCYISTKNYASPQRNIGIIKFNTNTGLLDTAFGTSGIAKINFNGNNVNECYNTLNQPDDKILVIGKTGTFSTGSFAIARLNTDGALDTTFGTGGKTVTPSNSEPDFPAIGCPSISDLKLLVIGQSNTTTMGPTGSVQIAKYRTGISLKSNDFKLKDTLVLSPNPTNNILNITTQETIKTIKIIDIAGRNTNITNFENNKIDVSNLQNGIYFLEIATEIGLQTQKFIKN